MAKGNKDNKQKKDIPLNPDDISPVSAKKKEPKVLRFPLIPSHSDDAFPIKRARKNDIKEDHIESSEDFIKPKTPTKEPKADAVNCKNKPEDAQPTEDVEARSGNDGEIEPNKGDEAQELPIAITIASVDITSAAKAGESAQSNGDHGGQCEEGTGEAKEEPSTSEITDPAELGEPEKEAEAEGSEETEDNDKKEDQVA